MNPLASAAIGSILRWALAIGAGYLVNANIWTGEEAGIYVTSATMALLSLGLSLWQKYRGRIKLLTALELAGATEHEVIALAALPTPSPPVSTPANQVPVSPLPVSDRLM